MKATLTTIGRETRVILEDSNTTGGGIIKVVQLTLDGTGLLSRPEFVGLTINQIKSDFTLEVDGNDLIGRDATTLESDGVINLGFGYSGTAYFRQLK